MKYLLNDVQAGGLTALELREVLIRRLAEYASRSRIPFNHNKVAAEQENFYVRSGDIVLVP